MSLVIMITNTYNYYEQRTLRSNMILNDTPLLDQEAVIKHNRENKTE